jgi:two-component system, NarL family, nitrate/nitrite response regulator NarP
MKRETTILIVDDHPLLRRGVRNVIAENPQFRVIAEASDGDEATELVNGLKPDIAIIDIDMPRSLALETLAGVRYSDHHPDHV